LQEGNDVLAGGLEHTHFLQRFEDIEENHLASMLLQNAKVRFHVVLGLRKVSGGWGEERKNGNEVMHVASFTLHVESELNKLRLAQRNRLGVSVLNGVWRLKFSRILPSFALACQLGFVELIMHSTSSLFAIKQTQNNRRTTREYMRYEYLLWWSRNATVIRWQFGCRNFVCFFFPILLFDIPPTLARRIDGCPTPVVTACDRPVRNDNEASEMGHSRR
jgi:hypothetical protein